MLAELHAHTTYSRGKKIFYESVSTPAEMLARAKRLGLGMLAITDHDEIRGALAAKRLEKKYGVKVIVGEEITTKSGHLLALGINELVRPGMTVRESVEAVHSQGGIAIAPHPFDFKRNGIRLESKHCDAIEVFNAMSIDRLTNRRAVRFAKKLGMPVTAGSDAHGELMLGYGLVEAESEEVDSFLKDIKGGNLKLKVDYMPLEAIRDTAIKKLCMSYDYTMNYIEKNYNWPQRVIAKSMMDIVSSQARGIDSFLKVVSYMAYGGVLFYSGFTNLVGFSALENRVKRI
ncbi:MAG: PHP domain-containing protein [Candidatus Aenigmarchaeota archaeon]|nr:PHP domain-containing protein [Candidatus Aenigmarchaeota archaeon]